MGQNNLDPVRHKKTDISALLITLFLVGCYASPLLLHANDSFTLYPKNKPSFYANYTLGLYLRTAVLKFHSLPFWVSIFEGGRSLFNYPMDITLTPFSFLSIFLGEVQGMNLTWFFLFLSGAGSMFYLTRIVLGYDIFGSVFSALAFSMSGVFVYLLDDGIFYAAGTLLLPLLFAFFIKAKEHLKYALFCSLVLSLLTFSIILFLPAIVLFLFLFALIEAFGHKDRRVTFDPSFLKTFVVVCLMAVLFSAVKILPLFQLLVFNSRPSGADYATAIAGANTWNLFLERILVPANIGPGTMYMGFLPVVFFLLTGSVYLRQCKSYLIVLLLFIVLSFGPNSPIDLHQLLWHLPIFNSIGEIAKYYSIVIVFLLALLAGKGFSVFRNLKLRFLAALFPVFVVSAAYADLFASNAGYFNSFNTKLDYDPAAGEPFHVRGLNIHQGDETISSALFYFLAKKNIGFINYDFALKQKTDVTPRYYLLPKYAFLAPSTSLWVLPNPCYRGEAYFLDERHRAQWIYDSPHSVHLKISAQAPDRLVINQNFDHDWHANMGNVENYGGLLSVKFEGSASGILRLTYFPKMFWAGFLISLVSFSVCGATLFKKRSTRAH